MKQLIFTDPHLQDKHLGELENVFSEIISYDADICICVGDYLERRPTPSEIYFATKWADRFVKKYKRFILIVGNHPKISNDFSSEDYLSYLGVELYNTLYVLKHNSKEYAYAHLMCEQSKKYFGKGDIDENKSETLLEKFNKYEYTIFGHQHIFQEITPSVYHLGSCRFVDFSETEVSKKYISIIENDIEFIELKSVIPAIDVTDVTKLNKINSNTKVRLILNDFEVFKNNINLIEKYKSKFVDFKLQLNFRNTENIQKEISSSLSFKDVVKEWIDNIEDKEVKMILKKEIDKENILLI